MLKTFALIVRRADVSRDEFRRHYEETHSPLALPLLEGLVRYVKYHLVADLHGKADFDVISGFWYVDGEAAAKTVSRVAAPEGEAIRRDEQTFMDTDRNTFFPVTEHPRVTGHEGVAESLQSFVFVKGPGDSPERFLEGFEKNALPALADVFGKPPFVLHHRVLGAGPGTDHDGIVQIAGEPDADALARWAGGLEADGARVLAVSTRLYETETPWEYPD